MCQCQAEIELRQIDEYLWSSHWMCPSLNISSSDVDAVCVTDAQVDIIIPLKTGICTFTEHIFSTSNQLCYTQEHVTLPSIYLLTRQRRCNPQPVHWAQTVHPARLFWRTGSNRVYRSQDCSLLGLSGKSWYFHSVLKWTVRETGEKQRNIYSPETGTLTTFFIINRIRLWLTVKFTIAVV